MENVTIILMYMKTNSRIKDMHGNPTNQDLAYKLLRWKET